MIHVKVFSTNASEGAVLLSKRLRELGVQSTKIPFKSKVAVHKSNDFLVNWGSSEYPNWIKRSKIRGTKGILNFPELVGRAINKLTTFQILHEVGVSIPEYVARGEEVPKTWKGILSRATLSGSGGRGIAFYQSGEDVDYGYPLYVQYIKKSKEYRVHVFKGGIIDVQEKRKRNDFQGTINYKIRNLESGWVFCREDIAPPIEVLNEAVAAVDALDLDFGAVDLIWNSHYQRAYVLEVNTAPGLEGSTVDSYAQAIIQHINSLGD